MLVRSGAVGEAQALQAVGGSSAQSGYVQGATALKGGFEEAPESLGGVAFAAPAAAASPEAKALDRRAEARMKGYVGEACPECGNFTMVRNGTCLKCDTCGGTTGCSADVTATNPSPASPGKVAEGRMGCGPMMQAPGASHDDRHSSPLSRFCFPHPIRSAPPTTFPSFAGEGARTLPRLRRGRWPQAGWGVGRPCGAGRLARTLAAASRRPARAFRTPSVGLRPTPSPLARRRGRVTDGVSADDAPPGYHAGVDEVRHTVSRRESSRGRGVGR